MADRISEIYATREHMRVLSLIFREEGIARAVSFELGSTGVSLLCRAGEVPLSFLGGLQTLLISLLSTPNPYSEHVIEELRLSPYHQAQDHPHTYDPSQHSNVHLHERPFFLHLSDRLRKKRLSAIVNISKYLD